MTTTLMQSMAERYRAAMQSGRASEAPQWIDCTRAGGGKTFTRWRYRFQDGSVYVERVKHGGGA